MIQYIERLRKIQYFRRGLYLDFEFSFKYDNIILMHSCIMY